MIRLAGVHKSLGNRQVLEGVDLEVPARGVTFVIGRSGAGKSVLSRCCVGLMRVDSGEVWVDGARIHGWPERKLTELRREVPYVVQGSALLDWLTLAQNVEVPLVRGFGFQLAEAEERARDALVRVDLGELSEKCPPEVGPGVRKQVAIARALALRPKAVLYDEPTTGLDAEAARRVDRLIREAADAGTTALVVSHDLTSLKDVAERVAVLDEGVIAFHGTVPEFLERREEHPAIRRFFHQEEAAEG